MDIKDWSTSWIMLRSPTDEVTAPMKGLVLDLTIWTYNKRSFSSEK